MTQDEGRRGHPGEVGRTGTVGRSGGQTLPAGLGTLETGPVTVPHEEEEPLPGERATTELGTVTVGAPGADAPFSTLPHHSKFRDDVGG